MIQENVQIQVIDIQNKDPLVLDHLQFHNHVIIFVLYIVIIIKYSTLIELLHVQGTLNFINSDEL